MAVSSNEYLNRLSKTRSVYDAANIVMAATRSAKDPAELMKVWQAYRRVYQNWYLSLSHDQRYASANYSNGDPSFWDALSPVASGTGKVANVAVQAVDVGKSVSQNGMIGGAGWEVAKAGLVKGASMVGGVLGAAALAGVGLFLTPSKVPDDNQEIVMLDKVVNKAVATKMNELMPLPAVSASEWPSFGAVPSGPAWRAGR